MHELLASKPSLLLNLRQQVKERRLPQLLATKANAALALLHWKLLDLIPLSKTKQVLHAKARSLQGKTEVHNRSFLHLRYSSVGGV